MKANGLLVKLLSYVNYSLCCWSHERIWDYDEIIEKRKVILKILEDQDKRFQVVPK